MWYLLSTIIGLQALADLGFAPTFTRLIAYAMGGVEHIEDFPRPCPRRRLPGRIRIGC